MNEKIKEIAKQAGMVMYPTGLGIQENTIWGDQNISKFAELLIKECIDQLDIEKVPSQIGYGLNLGKVAIQEHFGINK
jgi:hypothetical protein